MTGNQNANSKVESHDFVKEACGNNTPLQICKQKSIIMTSSVRMFHIKIVGQSPLKGNTLSLSVQYFAEILLISLKK